MKKQTHNLNKGAGRRWLLCLMLALSAFLQGGRASAQYCTTGLYTQGCTGYDWVIGSMSLYVNGSQHGILSSQSGQCPTNNLDDRTATSISVTPGDDLALSAFVKAPVGSAYYIAVWIDLNNNQSFDDAGEYMYTYTGVIPTPTSFGFFAYNFGGAANTFTVPAGTSGGQKRVRMRLYDNTNGVPAGSGGACTGAALGEAIDFTIDVNAPATPPAGYCTTGLYTQDCAGGNNNWWIAGSVLQSMDNDLTFHAFNPGPSGACPADNYDLATDPAIIAYPNQAYRLSLTIKSPQNENYAVSVWVDLNDDLDFDDAGEFQGTTTGVGIALGANSYLVVNTNNFTIPTGTTPGAKRARIRLFDGSGSQDACATGNFGETVDFTLNVPPCPQPTWTNMPTNHDTSSCPGTQFQFEPTFQDAATTYTYSRPAYPSLGLPTAVDHASGPISDLIQNQTGSISGVNYTIHATTGAQCNQDLTVVTEVPSEFHYNIGSSIRPVCNGDNGELTLYLPADSFSGVATFNGNADVTADAATTAFSTSSSGIQFTTANLTNTGADLSTVSYTFSGGMATNYATCPIADTTLSFQVVPDLTPYPNDTLVLTVCSGGQLSYAPQQFSIQTSSYYDYPVTENPNINYQYSSAPAGGFAGTFTNTTDQPQELIYKYHVSTSSLPGAICEDDYVVRVIVQPTPVLSSATNIGPFCNGEQISYTATSATPGVSFAFSASTSTSGVSGPGATFSATAINNGSSPDLLTIAYTLSLPGCAGNTQNVTGTIRPATTLSNAPANTAICSGGTFAYAPQSAASGATYMWSRAQVAGIGNPATSGNGDISETLANTGSTPAVATYNVTINANGCSSTESFTVTVNPTPTLSSATDLGMLCHGETLNYTATSATPGVQFSFIGIDGNLYDGPSIGWLADNNNDIGANPVVRNHYFILSLPGCASDTQVVTFIENPSVALNNVPTNAAICNGAGFGYAPQAEAAGATYSWTRAQANGIDNPPASGTGNISETLSNSGATPAVATYKVIATANGCSDTENVSVAVNPTPVLSSTLNPAATCDGAPFSYMPGSAVANATFTWERMATAGIANDPATGTGNINEMLDNTTAGPVVVTYHITASANNCDHQQDVTVTVNPTPVLSNVPASAAICDGQTFSYSPASATTGTTFQWMRAATSGISNSPASGAGNISEVLNNTTAGPVGVTYHITATANGCSSQQDVMVTVNPTPHLSNTPVNAAVCNNSLFSYSPASATAGTSYTWQRFVTPGIDNAAAGGSGNVNEQLMNSGNTPATATYLVTTNYAGCSSQESFDVTVNPTPHLSSTLLPAAVCDDEAFSYLPMSTVAGSSFQWSRPLVAGIANPASSGSGNINESLDNFSATPVDVPYAITTTANGCDNTQTVTVTVKPTPTLTSAASAAVCSHTAFNYTPASPVSGTAFAWTRAMAAGISNPATSGSGGINETLINTTPAPATAVYQYTLSAAGCSSTADVTVALKPRPELSSTLDTTLCTSSVLTYMPMSATTGTSFSWMRLPVVGISNASGSGTGSINEQLLNTTGEPVQATYTYALEADGCFNIEELIATVNPTPVLNAISDQTVCNGAMTDSIAFSGSSTGNLYTWANDNASVGLAGNGTGNIAAFTGSNAGNAPQMAHISVAPTFTHNGVSCAGASQSFSITVAHTPSVTATADAAQCAGTAFEPVILGGDNSGNVYSWTNNDTATGLGAGGAGTVSGFTGINTGAVDVSSTITVTPSFTINGLTCTGAADAFTYTVHPLPVIPVIDLHPAGTLCSGTMNQNFGATSLTAGVDWTWTAANATIAATAANGSIVSFDQGGGPAVITVTATIPATGCASSKSYTVQVGSSSAPAMPEIAYVNDQFIALQSNAASYQWGYDKVSNLVPIALNGQTDQNYYNASPDFDNRLYWVATSDGQGCTQKAYYNAPMLGIGTLNAAGGLRVYPNPASTMLNIEAAQSQQALRAEVLDMTGRKVMQTTLENGRGLFDVSSLPAGAYMVSIYTGQQRLGAVRFVKSN